MTKKILIALGAVFAILIVIDTVAVFSPKAVRLSASSNINSINLVPNTTVGGDTYGLAVNGTQIVDVNGNISSTLALTVSGTSTFSGNVIGISTTTLTKLTLTGSATSSITGTGNFVSNSTSTGFVLRATDGNCYLIKLGTNGAFGTSTAACQ